MPTEMDGIAMEQLLCIRQWNALQSPSQRSRMDELASDCSVNYDTSESKGRRCNCSQLQDYVMKVKV